MSRECREDFKKLQEYLATYSVSGNLQLEDCLALTKAMHKNYFSAITWNAELSQRKNNFSTTTGATEDIINRLSESVSDIGCAYFNWLHGSYKAARIMLRVAIENFIRAVSAIETPSQSTETSVYKMFEVAAAAQIITSRTAVKKQFNKLHTDYKLLCRDAHTVTDANMANISSLADFPNYESDSAKASKKVFIDVSKNITVMFCITFNTFFHTMHHRNKENILNSIPKSLKPIINGATN